MEQIRGLPTTMIPQSSKDGTGDRKLFVTIFFGQYLGSYEYGHKGNLILETFLHSTLLQLETCTYRHDEFHAHVNQ